MSKLNSLRLLESYLEDLDSLVEESNRLSELQVETDSNDYELNKNLNKIRKFLERHDDGYVFIFIFRPTGLLTSDTVRIMMN